MIRYIPSLPSAEDWGWMSCGGGCWADWLISDWGEGSCHIPWGPGPPPPPRPPKGASDGDKSIENDLCFPGIPVISSSLPLSSLILRSRVKKFTRFIIWNNNNWFYFQRTIELKSLPSGIVFSVLALLILRMFGFSVITIVCCCCWCCWECDGEGGGPRFPWPGEGYMGPKFGNPDIMFCLYKDFQCKSLFLLYSFVVSL